jgi:hypothetical protein
VSIGHPCDSEAILTRIFASSDLRWAAQIESPSTLSIQAFFLPTLLPPPDVVPAPARHPSRPAPPPPSDIGLRWDPTPPALVALGPRLPTLSPLPPLPPSGQAHYCLSGRHPPTRSWPNRGPSPPWPTAPSSPGLTARYLHWAELPHRPSPHVLR